MDWKVRKADGGLKGELSVPPDKSISHRAVMFGSISSGNCRINNFLFSEDCVRTLEAFRAMGIEITRQDNMITVQGKGLKGLTAPTHELYLGNSGTSMRIMSGVLAGQHFSAKLTGDESLSRRPMRRITEPLKNMGAEIDTLNGDFPPIRTTAAKRGLRAIEYHTPVASAQVKSCILAAGLYAEGTTSVTEPFQSRDHTERMLEHLSAEIRREGLTTRITGLKELIPADMDIPGDISSAAFFIVGALLVRGSDLVLRNVGLNPTRKGLITVLERMGGRIEILDLWGSSEPMGDIRVISSDLKGTTIKSEEIPSLIDEIPVLIIAAMMAEGQTRICGISELRIKESDRVKSMQDNLLKLGAGMREEGDSLIIEGGCSMFKSAELDSFGDHRIAMSMTIAALVSDEGCLIRDTACVNTSYPGFLDDLERMRA